jgi:hypothetical protein
MPQRGCYLEALDGSAPFPDQAARWPVRLRPLDLYGSATVASNGPRYFGFVVGAALQAAAAAERLMLAWDQCASS